MKKEIVKNSILTLLIFICVFLFYKIWFSEKLWSSDYNFFAALWGNQPIAVDTSSSIEDILQPEKIIFSGGGKRFVSTKGESGFEGYYNEVKSVLGKITEKTKFAESTEEEMISAIKASSVTVDFGTVFSGETGTFLGTYFPCESVRDVVISLNDTALGKPVVFVRDHKGGAVYKAVADMPLDKLSESVSGHILKNSGENIPFAFELGFNRTDTTEGSEISRKILLNSNILIGLTDVTAPAIKITPPEETELPSSKLNMLLSQFGIERATARKYIETNDDVLFVGSGATLKISKSGTLEYQAEASGPVIYDASSKNALPSAVGNIFSLVRTVFRSFDISSPALQISSDLVNLPNASGEITVYIDYYLDSIPVMAWDNGHAISITVKNGRLISYKQQICTLSKGDGKLTAGNMLQAVDGLYAVLPLKEDETATVSDIFVAYTGEDSISWCAKIDGSDRLIVINKEGTP